MIVTMLKTTVICRAEDREASLEKLRELGALHVVHCRKPESERQSALEQEIGIMERMANILAEYRDKNSGAAPALPPEEIANKALEAFNAMTAAGKELDQYRREREKLEPWGNFSFDLIDELREKGLYAYLCHVQPEALEKLREKGPVEVVSGTKHSLFVVLVSDKKLDAAALPLAPMPTERMSLEEIRSEISTLELQLEERKAELRVLSGALDSVHRHVGELRAELEYVSNANGMGQHGELSYIQGFVPADRADNLKAAARDNGWAFRLDPVEATDDPPTLIRPPKLCGIAKPIFDFISIFPGYREWDISACFLFYFTIYFGMIVGDAGYGLVLLAATLFAKYKLKGKFQREIALFTVLCCSTIVWGALTANYFGIEQKLIPGLKCLTGPSSTQSVQWFCFLLGALHLCTAHVWRALLEYKKLAALGQLGWVLVLIGNFFVAIKLVVFSESPLPVFVPWLYVVGAGLILAFYVQWREISSVFNIPFGFIGSFVDLLSFIRLFAVGLASFYIADSFNKMIREIIAGQSGFTLVIVAFVLGIALILGHLLNIALSLMGVLVHGIRLNTLEFSNHMELQWGGREYKPFRRDHDNNNEA